MAVTGNVAEVFRSWQGEGRLLGQRMVFVRLAGCRVDCRYCDTAWAFEVPDSVAVPEGKGERRPNPLDIATVIELVEAADPGGSAPVSLTGGEPLEQIEFVVALCDALAPREVMLETAGLDGEALARAAARVRWVACDIKLPSSTGQADVLDRHDRAFATGALASVETFFKIVVDGDVEPSEWERAADLAAATRPGATVYLQPVTPLGGSPALPRERLDALADRLLSRGLAVRVVPQVHKLLGVR